MRVNVMIWGSLKKKRALNREHDDRRVDGIGPTVPYVCLCGHFNVEKNDKRADGIGYLILGQTRQNSSICFMFLKIGIGLPWWSERQSIGVTSLIVDHIYI